MIRLTLFLSSLIMFSSSFSQGWKTYYDSTKVFWGSDWKKTSDLLIKAQGIATIDLGIFHENYFAISEDLGVCHLQLGNTAKAEATFRSILENKREIMSAKDASYIHTMTLLADVLVTNNQLARADSLLRYANKYADNSVGFNVYKGLANIHRKRQRLDSAHFYYSKAYELVDIDERLTEAEKQHFKIILADFKREYQDYEMAEVLFEEVGQAFSRSIIPQKELSLYGQFLNAYGLFLLETGEYGLAEKATLEALQIWDGITSISPAHKAQSYNNLAALYSALGFLDKAEGYLNRSLRICTLAFGEKDKRCLNIQNNLASIALQQGNTEKAIRLYEKLLKQFQEVFTRDYVTLVNNLALAYRKAARNQDAEKIYLQLKDHVELKDQFPVLYSAALNNLGMMYLKQQSFDLAEQHLLQSITIKKEVYGQRHPMITQNLYNLASLYQVTNDLDKAAPLYNEAFENQMLMIRYLFPNLTSRQKMQFYTKAKQNFEQYCSFAIRYYKKDPTVLATLMDRQLATKGLLFYSDQELNVLSKLEDDLIAQDLNRLKRLRLEIATRVEHPNKSREANDKIMALATEAEQLEKQLALKSNLSAPSTHHTTDWSELKNNLQSDEALVELIRFRKFDASSNASIDFQSGELELGFTDSTYYAALIITDTTTAHPALVLLKNGKDIEGRYFQYYKNALRYQLEDDRSYNVFWQDISKKIVGKNKIYLVNDGIYHHINLEILRNPETQQFLLEKQSFYYLTNSIELLDRQEAIKSTKRRSALLIGNPDFAGAGSPGSEQTLSMPVSINSKALKPLPGTKDEVMKIGSMLEKKGWSLDVLLGPDASEDMLKQIKSPEILHLATHGFFESNATSRKLYSYHHPLMQSGLYLAGAERSLLQQNSSKDPYQGIVTAYELMNYDLSKTQLVVLSACETGLGEIDHGEGVYGLQRALHMAGAETVIHSLWKVDDQATQKLMVSFYEFLLKGNTPKIALQLAQKDMMKSYPHPYYWGAFVVSGS